MKHITIHDYLPKVPEYLIEPLDAIIAKPSWNGDDTDDEHHVRIKTASEDLQKWCSSLFPERTIYSYYQETHSHRFNGLIHWDPGARGEFDGRTHVFHYLLTTGGEKVETIFYHKKPGTDLNNQYGPSKEECAEKLVEVERYCVPLHTWFRIPVDIYHAVEGIEVGKRRISVCFVIYGDPGDYSPDIA